MRNLDKKKLVKAAQRTCRPQEVKRWGICAVFVSVAKKKAHVRNPAQPEWLMSRFSKFFVAVQVRMVLVLMWLLAVSCTQSHRGILSCGLLVLRDCIYMCNLGCDHAIFPTHWFPSMYVGIAAWNRCSVMVFTLHGLWLCESTALQKKNHSDWHNWCFYLFIVDIWWYLCIYLVYFR